MICPCPCLNLLLARQHYHHVHGVSQVPDAFPSGLQLVGLAPEVKVRARRFLVNCFVGGRGGDLASASVLIDRFEASLAPPVSFFSRL